MPRGAKAGHPRWGGRTKGTPNRASIAREKQVAETGATPLDGLIFVYRHYLAEAQKILSNPKASKAKIDAVLENVRTSAKEAAPYTHPRLAALAAMRAPEPGATTLEAMLLALDGAANDDDRLLEGPVIDGKVDAAE